MGILENIETSLAQLVDGQRTLIALLTNGQQPTPAAPVPLPETVPPTPAPATVPASPAPAPVPPAAPPVPPVQPAPAAPPVPPVQPAPAAAPSAAPFADSKGLMAYCMQKYQTLGPVKGGMIQNILLQMGVNNINALQPAQYGQFYQQVEAL